MKLYAAPDKLKIIKTAAGAVAAASAAYAMGLEYAVSAGIIALLTIQDTRRETIAVTLKRLAAFVIAVLLCIICFKTLGFTLPALGIVLALFIFICGSLGMNEAVAMNSVIATHFFASADCSAAMIANEALLLLTGAGTGVLLNIFVPVRLMRIRRIQQETDSRIKRILGRMAVYILESDRSGYTGSCFDEVSSLLSDLRLESLRYIGNSFSGQKDYFLKYTDMRIKQCGILQRIYTDIIRLDKPQRFGVPISGFLQRISDEFHEINDAEGLLEGASELFVMYSEQPLPKTREEFEGRALLYHILRDLEYFISIKAEFAAGLSEREKARFWGYADPEKGADAPH